MGEKAHFTELVSDYLKNIMQVQREKYGEDDSGYKALFYQYIQSENEEKSMQEHNLKHYEATVGDNLSGLRFVERLYKRQATIDMTLACSAHCRYCLRQNYELGIMSEEDMREIVKYLSNDKYLKEVLITGGDPLLIPEQLIKFMNMIITFAPNILFIRIGSRLPVQNPSKISKELLVFFEENSNKVKFELGIQVNHVIELQNEAKECITSIQKSGVHVYAQNVLLKGVNDSLEALIELYDTLRYLNIEAHYLFHPVPMTRTAQFRIPLTEFLDLSRKLTSSGEIPGRSKPMFTLMTDVGKCTLYSGIVGEKDELGYYDIFTGYKLESRKRWHEDYKLPESAFVDENGYIHVKYLDGGNLL